MFIPNYCEQCEECTELGNGVFKCNHTGKEINIDKDTPNSVDGCWYEKYLN